MRRETNPKPKKKATEKNEVALPSHTSEGRQVIEQATVFKAKHSSPLKLLNSTPSKAELS